MPNIAITLREDDQIRIEQILVDRDGKAALEFLRRVLKPKVERRLKSGCRPVFEGPSLGS